GDRSKVPIEPYLTDQWFVNARELEKAALGKVRDGSTKFVPENWTRVYYNWMENIEPWCTSRQLWWGHRVPVWYDVEGNGYCALSQEEAAEQARKRYGPNVEIEFRDN